MKFFKNKRNKLILFLVVSAILVVGGIALHKYFTAVEEPAGSLHTASEPNLSFMLSELESSPAFSVEQENKFVLLTAGLGEEVVRQECKPIRGVVADTLNVNENNEKNKEDIKNTNESTIDSTPEPTPEATPEVTPEPVEPKPVEDEWVSLGTFKITFYCTCKKCNGKWYGYPTASGTDYVEGRTIAVDKSVIPLGTKVKIADWGTYTAEDTGVRGNQIDIYLNSHSACYEYGVLYKEVWIKK